MTIIHGWLSSRGVFDEGSAFFMARSHYGSLVAALPRCGKKIFARGEEFKDLCYREEIGEIKEGY